MNKNSKDSSYTMMKKSKLESIQNEIDHLKNKQNLLEKNQKKTDNIVEATARRVETL